MNFDKINNDRTLYDLCRKYKYYYKQYQDVQPLKDKYYSKYLYQAYLEAENNLNKILMEIIYCIFENTGALTRVTITGDKPNRIPTFDNVFFAQTPANKTTIKGEEFAEIMTELITIKGKKEGWFK